MIIVLRKISRSIIAAHQNTITRPLIHGIKIQQQNVPNHPNVTRVESQCKSRQQR